MIYRSIELSAERAIVDVFKQAKIDALVHSFKPSATVEAIIDTTEHDEAIRAKTIDEAIENIIHTLYESNVDEETINMCKRLFEQMKGIKNE